MVEGGGCYGSTTVIRQLDFDFGGLESHSGEGPAETLRGKGTLKGNFISTRKHETNCKRKTEYLTSKSCDGCSFHVKTGFRSM